MINLLNLIKEGLLIPADTWANINKRLNSSRLDCSRQADHLRATPGGSLGPGGGVGRIHNKCLYREAPPRDPIPYPPGGALPYKRLMGMYRWMGSHFHDWTTIMGLHFQKTY